MKVLSSNFSTSMKKIHFKVKAKKFLWNLLRCLLILSVFLYFLVLDHINWIAFGSSLIIFILFSTISILEKVKKEKELEIQIPSSKIEFLKDVAKESFSRFSTLKDFEKFSEKSEFLFNFSFGVATVKKTKERIVFSIHPLYCMDYTENNFEPEALEFIRKQFPNNSVSEILNDRLSKNQLKTLKIIFLHELGHYFFNDCKNSTAKGMISNFLISMFPFLVPLYYLLANIFSDSHSYHQNGIFGIIVALTGLSLILESSLDKSQELRADAFAAENSSPEETLKELSKVFIHNTESKKNEKNLIKRFFDFLETGEKKMSYYLYGTHPKTEIREKNLKNFHRNVD